MLVTTQTSSEVSDMLNLYYTEKVLGLQEVEIKKIQDNEKSFEIEVEQERKECKCPCCGQRTDKIHDYRRQRVKELPAFGKRVVLVLRKRRYACSCGKRFAEPNAFLARCDCFKKYDRSNVKHFVSDMSITCCSSSSLTIGKEPKFCGAKLL